MNEESQAQHCGDTCSAVAAMGVAFREYVPPEQRMAAAIKQVLSGKMSQRGAAEENGVARRTLERRLNEVAQMRHPSKTQSSTQSSADPQPIPSDPQPLERSQAEQDKLRRTTAIRNLARESGMGKVNGKYVRDIGAVAIYEALAAAGIEVPQDITPRSLLSKKQKTAIPTTSNEPATTERLSANDPLAVIPNWGEQGDSFDRYDSEIDSGDAIRDEVCQQVQQSNRPADFKRAIFLLRELDDICTEAWYRRHPEPWGHDDWAHVCSEVATVYSLVRQRAQEECEDALLARTAIETRATVVP